MATITITSAETDEQLKAAVAQANANNEDDRIVFAPELSGQTIRLTSPLNFSSNHKTTIEGDIDGDGAIDITISGDFDGNGELNLSDIGTTIDAGRTGAVSLDGLRLTSLYFNGGFYNQDAVSTIGGAAITTTGADLTLRNMQIDNAVAKGNPGGERYYSASVGTIVALYGGDNVIENVLFDNVEARGGSGEFLYYPAGGVAGITVSGRNDAKLAFNNIGFNNARAIGGSDLPTQLPEYAKTGAYGVVGIVIRPFFGNEVTGIDGQARIFVSGDTSSAVSGTGELGSQPAVLGFFNSDGDEPAELEVISLSPSAGDDRFRFADETDPLTLLGFAGNDSLSSGAGDDLLEGGEGDDRLDAGDGNDRLEGGAGADEVFGRGADDIAKGGSGNDTVKGHEGNDRVIGQADDDRLVGGAGDDTIVGGGGDDALFGRNGDDLLRGGGGDDRLEGNAGDDTLRGNDGQDIFSFKRNDGRDLVRDFRQDEDLIEIRNGAEDIDDLAIIRNGNKIVIEFKGTTIELQQAAAIDLDENDFLF